MPQQATENGSAEMLVRRLQADIRARGLGPGDRYLTASKAGAFLGVSTTAANRAMKLLADRNMLVRRRNQGTFIGPEMNATAISIRTVHVLMEARDRVGSTVAFDDLVAGIREAVAESNVQISFLPAVASLAFVKQLLGGAQSIGQLAGVVAISCPREIYRFLDDSGIPTVVFGSLYPDQQHLPSIDLDHRESGRLLGEYLTNRGHRRIALFSPTLGHRPGNNFFHDGLCEALTRAELPPTALLIRTVPAEPDVIRAQIEHMAQASDPPTAVITHSLNIVRMIEWSAQQLGLVMPDRLEVVFQEHATERTGTMPHVHVESTQYFAQTARQIGQMLNAVIEAQPLERTRVVIPMRLVRPDGE